MTRPQLHCPDHAPARYHMRLALGSQFRPPLCRRLAVIWILRLRLLVHGYAGFPRRGIPLPTLVPHDLSAFASTSEIGWAPQPGWMPA